MLNLGLRRFYILLLFTAPFNTGITGFDTESSITGLYTGPYFDPLTITNVTAHLGDRAVLPCTVRQLGDKSVSWVRLRDADILTVDRYTFVSDDRFEAHFSAPHETWNLIIKYVQERDAGIYECQVSTEPKMSQHFTLRVVVPRVNVVPPGDRFVKVGSKVTIDCEITDVVQTPDYIFWYHDGVRVLENKDSNLGVTVERTGDESIKSTLTISRVRRSESGNYTCMPSNLYASSISLHVLNEEHREAMKDGRNASCKMERPIYLIMLLACLAAFSKLFKQASLPEYSPKKTTRSLKKKKNGRYTNSKQLASCSDKMVSQQEIWENFLNLAQEYGTQSDLIKKYNEEDGKPLINKFEEVNNLIMTSNDKSLVFGMKNFVNSYEQDRTTEHDDDLDEPRLQNSLHKSLINEISHQGERNINFYCNNSMPKYFNRNFCKLYV